MANIKTEVAIIGAGLTGMTMACSLAGRGLLVTVIESADIKTLQNKKSDGRTCAISFGSAKIFDEIGVWEDMSSEAGRINDIRVTDGDSPMFLHYDHRLAGSNPMGYIVENYHIRKSLFKRADSLKNIQIIDNIKYLSIERSSNNVVVTLDDGITITSSLLIAADGRNSKVRNDAGIKSTNWSYKQTGIVCTVKHEKSHNRTAQEKFLPAGPFAILPMKDENHSSLVWTEKETLAPVFLKMDDDEFLEHLSSRFGDYLGKIEVAGNRFAYPLSLMLAYRYTDTRLALIGDAAHAMHPIAGQGFNLGIRDVPVLTKLITNAKNLGQDVGTASILEEYEKSRKFDNISLLAITDSLNRLFSNDITLAKIVRRIGLSTIEKIPALKKQFVKHAMGTADYI